MDQLSIDLAAERLGGQVLFATDDFFAPKENLLKASRAVWIEDKYTDRGKWMDGWESRRRRTPGHDWADIRLGLPGVVRSVVVDTAFFRGNYPEQCSIEGCTGDPQQDPWIEILPRTNLQGDHENRFPIDSPYRFTHLRLHIYPDGGVARFRAYGEGVPAWMEPGRTPDELDLAAVENGARVVECSDMFFGSRHNLIMPGHATHMGDGWETRRRRGPGHDWVIVELGTWGDVESIDFDTSHFKGNAPGQVMIEACRLADGQALGEAAWHELVPRTPVSPDRLHRFHRHIKPLGETSHVRVNVYPDGGVARLRIYGTVTEQGRLRAGLRWFNTLTAEAAEAMVKRCCGATRWGREVVAARPYSSADALYRMADEAWWKLEEKDWQEAFACHPAIGSRDAGKQDARASGWSAQEQAGTRGATPAVTEALAQYNQQYRDRFGYTYIVCATGKSADEMLDIVKARLGNEPAREVRVAAEEQSKITRLRLEKMLRG